MRESLDEGESLSKVYETITKLSLQFPRSHCENAQKIEFLCNAAIGSEWATESLSRIGTHELSFQKLYGESDAPYQLSREAKSAVLWDNAEGIRNLED